jgi:hypothetical protein
MSSDDLAHNDHLVRLQRVLDRLEQVTKQAKDLSRMSDELHREAAESMKLVKAAASDIAPVVSRTRKRKRR